MFTERNGSRRVKFGAISLIDKAERGQGETLGKAANRASQNINLLKLNESRSYGITF